MFSGFFVFLVNVCDSTRHTFSHLQASVAVAVRQYLHHLNWKLTNHSFHLHHTTSVLQAVDEAPSSNMTPTLHCVRHAQGYHNLSVANHNMHDPLLTSYGEEQCRALQKNFPDMRSVDLVVASPLKRTINTALIAFEPVLMEKGLKVIALPELQETSDLPCDTGSSLEEITRDYEGKPVDLSLVKPGWDSKRMKWAPTATAIEKRARDARMWLMQRPEKEIVLVSHGLCTFS